MTIIKSIRIALLKRRLRKAYATYLAAGNRSDRLDCGNALAGHICGTPDMSHVHKLRAEVNATMDRLAELGENVPARLS